MRDARGELSERGELLGLHQPVLRRPQLLQRFRQFARTRLDTLEQTNVFDGNGGLIGERRGEFDLLVGKRPHLGTRHDDDADRLAFAQHRDADDGTEITQPLCLVEGVVGVRLDVGNVNDGPLKQCTRRCRAAIRHDRNVSDVLHEFGGKSVRLAAKKYAVLLPGDGGLLGIA